MSLLNSSMYKKRSSLINEKEHLSPMAERIMGLATKCRTRVGRSIADSQLNRFFDELHPKDEIALESAIEELVAKGYLNKDGTLLKYR